MNLNYYLTQKLLTKVIFNFKLMQTSWNIWVTYITYVRLAGWKDLSLFKGILTIMIEYYIYLLYLQFSHEEDTLTWRKKTLAGHKLMYTTRHILVLYYTFIDIVIYETA